MSKIGTRGVTLLATLVVVLSASSVRADEQAFGVVSVREVPRDAPRLIRDQNFSFVLPGGQFVDPRITLTPMIIFAFEIPSYVQLIGLPRWAQEQEFSVAAKPPEGFPLLAPNENREQVRAMMREMLASRFHLRVHTESREERILKLEVDRGGLTLKAVDPPVPPEKEGFVNIAAGDSGGRMIGKKVTMAGVARALTVMLHRQVLNETGLKNYYTFDVKWSAPEPVDEGTVKPGLGNEGEGALMSGLKDLFGLRLRSAIGPVKYWVVDNVEHPTAN
jgi:uncharacterized protein (TIGR03435 family)